MKTKEILGLRAFSRSADYDIQIYNRLYRKLNDLKKAAEEHKIADIPGFGKKSEELILKNISMLASLHAFLEVYNPYLACCI